MVVLLAFWRACWDPNAVANIPGWLQRICHLTGSVVFDDPSLALRIQLSRWMVITTAATGAWIAILNRRRLWNAIGALVNQESDPINLAIFRIVVFWQIYNLCYFDFISLIASLPVGLQYPPQTALPRIGPWAHASIWPVHTVPPAVIAGAGTVMKWAAVAGAIGLFSRLSAAIVSFLFLFDWGRLQWYGKVDHHHHLLWFAILLAVSPCGDALSVDWLIARLRGKNPPVRGRQYGMPLAFAMILMGVIYLFPGLWKICRSGLDWALSDSPKLMMYQEWRAYGNWLPWFRLDQHPWLYHVGALSVILFELSFLFLLLGRRTRLLAGAMGLSFHMMTYLTLNIEFETLRNCYVVFVDWGRLLRRRAAPAMASPPGWRPLTATAVAGTLLVVGNLWAGATRAMDGWPLACYPPFDGLSETYSRALRMEVTTSSGEHRVIVPDEYRTVFRNRWNNLLQRIISSRNQQERRDKLQLVWQVLARTDPAMADVRHVRFYTVRSFVDPSHWRDEPDDPQFLYEADIAP